MAGVRSLAIPIGHEALTMSKSSAGLEVQTGCKRQQVICKINR